jgi:hypothetical protein
MLQSNSESQEDLSGSFCLSTASLAPVEYYRILACSDEVWIEQQEHFLKQSYRNRYNIATANGIMALSIPVEKSATGKTLIRDTRIAEHGNWQQQHWKAIESAYSSSPFFEFYADDLRPFYVKKCSFLWDFNLEIQHLITDLIDFEPIIRFTDVYFDESIGGITDLRNEIHPKKKDYLSGYRPYYQVFQQKFGFQHNLSIIDLLFNMGNESILFLKNS